MTLPIQDWPHEVAAARGEQHAGDFVRVVDRLAAAVSDPAAPDEALRLLATALRAQGKARAAAEVRKALVARQPNSAVAEHNLASVLGDCDESVQSEQAARRAIAKGGQAPETWLVLGRALMGQGRLEEAGAAFRQATRLRPGFLPAFRDLAQLSWMRDADLACLEATLAPLTTLARTEEAAALLLSSILRNTAGDHAALASLEPWIEASSLNVSLAAAAAASGVNTELALTYAQRAAALGGDDPRARLALASALLTRERAEEAMPLLEALLRLDPANQHVRALMTTAWRITGDARALSSADYERLVRIYRLAEGDPDRAAWLKRTAAALRDLHPFKGHPLQQSVRNGAQSRIDPRSAGDPDIDRLFEELAAPISAYIEEVRPDWFGAAWPEGWRIGGAWSVKLGAGGRHTDHVHPRGWVSSAVYIETPPAVDRQGREGWLRFGAARIGGAFTLPAQHWVRPEVGSLVLFPSWLWHGTEPFSGLGERLTVAFDVVPGQD